jgi:DNA polymerase I-like protein with 3'-5' exonuclease and polymerase domains
MYRDDPFLDEHSYVTEVSGLAEQHGKKAGRKYAKNLRFGVGYGMQIPRMMTQFGWTQEFAEDLYKKVSDAAPWLFELMEQVQDVVIKRRYIKTLVGRRVHMRPGKDKDAYKFMNYLIQGSASDMTKLATVAVFAGMKHNWEIEQTTIDEMAITVHDEDDFDIDCTDVEKAVKRTMEIRNCMENTSGCDLPIISCPEIGTSWADGVEWEKSFGDCEDFVRKAYTAIHNGTFSDFKKKVKAFSSREEDDGLTFAQFCFQVDEDEAEENAENIA